jgi:hypothetical protein
MADERTVLATKCAEWILASTSCEIKENLKLIDDHRIGKSSKLNQTQLDQLIQKCALKIPDLSCDAAVLDQYSDYWMGLLNDAFSKLGKEYSTSLITDQSEKDRLLERVKHEVGKEPIFLNLEFINDAKEHHLYTVMLRCHIVGVQFVNKKTT